MNVGDRVLIKGLTEGDVVEVEGDRVKVDEHSEVRWPLWWDRSYLVKVERRECSMCGVEVEYPSHLDASGRCDECRP